MKENNLLRGCLNLLTIIFSVSSIALVLFFTSEYKNKETQISQLPPHVNMAPIPIFDSQWDGIWIDQHGESLAFAPRMDGVYEGRSENVHITFSVMEEYRDHGLAMYCVKTECRADLIKLENNVIRDVSFAVLHLERFDE